MSLSEVYIGLGGNIGDTYTLMQQVLKSIAALPDVQDLEVSRFYVTEPVSDIPQRDFLNAVCRFKTSLSARTLFRYLQEIEILLGRQQTKIKNAPRVIDLDILLFGLEIHQDSDLQIPHPRWQERAFVLQPLSDLTDSVRVPDPKAPEGYACVRLKRKKMI